MLNGVLGIGFPSVMDGDIIDVNFVRFTRLVFGPVQIFKNIAKNSIAERNLQNGYYNSNSGISGLANARVNDVAMTVLPNAPVDDATGLPVPTIAVATDGGVSVIKGDRNVWDDTSSSGVTAGVAK